jgi:hypothetical protein
MILHDGMRSEVLANLTRKERVLPAEPSQVITLKRNFGVEGKSLASFEDTPQWKPVICRLFIQSKGSPHILLGEFYISREIEFNSPSPWASKRRTKKKRGNAPDNDSQLSTIIPSRLFQTKGRFI